MVSGLMEVWDGLSRSQKQHATLVALVAMWVMRNYAFSCAVLMAVWWFLAERKPTTESFKPFFEAWYTTQYYPRVASKVLQDLDRKAETEARRGNLFSFLGEQAKGLLVRNTKGLQASAGLELLYQNSFPPVFVDNGVFLSATLDLSAGTDAQPANVTFWGIYGTWMIAPYISMNFEEQPTGDDRSSSGQTSQG
mmetsp:Transcript_8021/g.12943  ORF Transcript_8021/g.12943 Transcript_8021/m.12943 type:complete len:194 (+) Transcript_8021:214-795(+)|eukprot:CAMPEP_0203769722 /NCGR_PEP_ID=MMETSP0099_2-20121227/2366_1 /ASSEMBLY_ACC=CAM_ASM_000209 /TAXON_ID=96639 /ORGANISM=" , Strain NY0313808BC1" /LENGTH=193 /DNA_ID=CAMNT_0050666685 /DNA_START=149 /DNA_END=730 /DNA_ORIENTATION=+